LAVTVAALLVGGALAFAAMQGGATAPLSLDVTNSALTPSSSPWLRSASLTTTGTNELIVAFIAVDGPARQASQWITRVSGGGLTWTRAIGSNGQAGAAEAWTAWATTPLSHARVTAVPKVLGFEGSITLAAFKGATSTISNVRSASSPSGQPTVTVTTSMTGAWVWAVGNDWDNGIPRSPALGQSLASQFVDSNIGNTFWTQRQTSPNAASGTPVAIQDMKPSSDQWEYAALEIDPSGVAGPPPPAVTTTTSGGMPSTTTTSKPPSTTTTTKPPATTTTSTSAPSTTTTTKPPSTTTTSTTAPPGGGGAGQCITGPQDNLGPYSYAAITNSNGYNTYVGNNEWGANSGTSQKICGTSPGSWTLQASAVPSNYTGVQTYPDIQQLMDDYCGGTWNTCSNTTDTPLSALHSLTSTYGTVNPPLAQGDWEAAYDIWLNNTPNSEIMIWTTTSNVRLADNGSQVFNTNVTIAGQSYTYMNYGGGLPILVLNSNAASGTIDVLAALKYLQSIGQVSANATLAQLDFGWEICNTAGTTQTFQVNNYSISMS
jgi:hypothetical protein